MVLTAMVAMRGSARRQRRAGVEAEPAEGQDQRPDDGHRQVVAGDGADGPVAPELAGARPEHDGAGQRRHAARHVHHRRAGEVDVTVPEARQFAPSAASQPPPQTQLP